MLVIGYPKSGNTWFCYLLAYCLNVPYDNLMEPGVHPRDEYQRRLVKGGLPHKSCIDITKGVWSTHEYSTFKEYLDRDFTVYLVRDGRDVMVSYYYYLNKFLVKEHKKIKRTGALEGLIGLFKRSETRRFSAFIKKRSKEWKKHVVKCTAEEPDIIVRYEELNLAAEKTLKKIFIKLGVEVEEDVIRSAVESFSFKKLSGREKGSEDSSNFFRKGIVGDWQNKFSKKDRDCFKKNAGDMLIQLGYEKDFEW